MHQLGQRLVAQRGIALQLLQQAQIGAIEFDLFHKVAILLILFLIQRREK
jgi:hypothetical protein